MTPPTPEEEEAANAWAQSVIDLDANAGVATTGRAASHLSNLLTALQAKGHTALQASHDELLAENAELTKALTGLTSSGSEFFIRKGDRFVADIDACVSWVRRSKEDAHRRTVEAIKEKRALQASLDEAREALGLAKSRLNQIALTRRVAGPIATVAQQGAHEVAEAITRLSKGGEA